MDYEKYPKESIEIAQEPPKFHDAIKSVPEQVVLQTYILDPGQDALLDGEGAKATWMKNGLYVTIRRIDKSNTEKVDGVNRQVALLSNVADPSIPPLVEWYDLEKHIYLITEWRSGITLRKFVQEYGSLSEEKLKTVVTQLYSGLACIFYAGYAHLRLTDETLFLDDHAGLSIGGLEYAHEYSKEVADELYAATSARYGSDIYVAPEVFADVSYNARKATIWSVGVVTYFMATGQTDHLRSLGHPSFETTESPPTERRRSSTAGKRLSISQQARIVTYPNTTRFGVPNWIRDIVSKMLIVHAWKRAELIEVASKVPKEFVSKDTRPLMELAWLDYKIHVGPLAGLDFSYGKDSSASSMYSGISNFSETLTSLLPGRRRSSTTGENSQNAGRRRSSLKNFLSR